MAIVASSLRCSRLPGDVLPNAAILALWPVNVAVELCTLFEYLHLAVRDIDFCYGQDCHESPPNMEVHAQGRRKHLNQ
jgi:hypothetical protein